jgi:hypothetical protein
MDNIYEILEEYHRDNEAFIRKYGCKPEETMPDDAPPEKPLPLHEDIFEAGNYKTVEIIKENE